MQTQEKIRQKMRENAAAKGLSKAATLERSDPRGARRDTKIIPESNKSQRKKIDSAVKELEKNQSGSDQE